MKKILIIQTAFTGDVVLATALLEDFISAYPDVLIDFLVRKGNEDLLKGHPLLRNVIVWNKKSDKYSGLFGILRKCRSESYDVVVNLQRYSATGFLTAFSGAKHRIGYRGNIFSLFYTRSMKHVIGKPGMHEIDRNFELVKPLLPVGSTAKVPRLYPAKADFDRIDSLKVTNCITVSPASVWFTKQWPAHKWAELIDRIPADTEVYLLGGPADIGCCAQVSNLCKKAVPINLAGKLRFLESAALMSRAKMNFTNDSAPLHMAGAVGAPVQAVFCSTVPDFGFGPFLPTGHVIETSEKLECRPCGLHGRSACPKGHFRCAESIDPSKFDLSISDP